MSNQDSQDELKEAIGINKGFDLGYFYITYPGIESALIHETTLDELVKRINAHTQKAITAARIAELEELLGQQDHEGYPVEPTSNTIRERIATLTNQPKKGISNE